MTDIFYILSLLEETIEKPNVEALSLSKGGWEQWLQAQLWLDLTLRLKSNVAIEREREYDNGKQRCDIILTENINIQNLGGASQNHEHWIELKCFGQFRETDVKAFINSCIEDINKLKYHFAFKRDPSATIIKQVMAFSIIPKRFDVSNNLFLANEAILKSTNSFNIYYWHLKYKVLNC